MVMGYGNGTGPNDVVWFCHCCHWSGILRADEYHRCPPPKRAVP